MRTPRTWPTGQVLFFDGRKPIPKEDRRKRWDKWCPEAAGEFQEG